MTASKIVAAAASSAGGGTTDVDEVFSTHLYTGTGSSQTITNNIDLTEGGIVWLKGRSAAYDNYIADTVMGVQKHFKVNGPTLENHSDGLTAFNNNGFTIGSWGDINTSGQTWASWSWRKAPKYFDVISYTGNGTAGRTLAHNLGCDVGMIIIHSTANNRAGVVWHKGYSSTTQGYTYMNSTNAEDLSSNLWNSTAPTSSVITLGTNSLVNSNGETYVAYLFAHNNNDGEFGPDSDQDIIKCGSYTGNGTNQNIDLGFEAQWVLTKNITDSGWNWRISDVMRGMPTGGLDAVELQANTSSAEADLNSSYGPRAHVDGFSIYGGQFGYNTSGKTYIYMAIRRGSLNIPDDATKVFNVATKSANEPAYVSNFTVDMALRANAINGLHDTNVATRLTGKYFGLSNSNYQFQDGNEYEWDYMDGWNSNASNDTNSYSWMWKRAPGYFDVVCYTGDGQAGRTVNHNLGVAPEMIWIKGRTLYGWTVYHKAIGNSKIINLNDTYFAYTQANFNNTDPTSSVFTLGSIAGTNGSTQPFIAYLFATVAGVSKVGSVTHSGSSTDVDCGFASGARFVLLKRTDSTGSWVLFDTARGITSGNDPYLKLNSTSAEVTTLDQLDPLSSGFQITGDFNDGDYIFYAIA